MNGDRRMADNKLNFDRPLLSVRRRVVPSRGCEETKTAHRIPAHRSELKSGPVRNPGVVPFVWERTPGQPKEDVLQPTVLAPKPPPGRNIESSKDETSSSDSWDSDEAYADAPDTLSRTESFSLNCSTSGLSGQVDFGESVSTDVHARDRGFMMDRFLPAAKAVASETTTPQYVTGKQNDVVRDKSQSVSRYVKPSLRYGPSFAKRYAQYQENDNDEEEESDDGYDHPQDLSSSVCGLLPRFCVRGSLSIINPVPAAMSMRSRSTKLVDKIQTAKQLDEYKTKSRRNERCCLERRHSTATHDDALLSCREVKEVFAIPEVRKHAFEDSNSGSAVIEKTLYVDTIQVVESPNLDQTDSSHEDLQKLKTTNGDEGSWPNAFSIFCSTDHNKPNETTTETEATEDGLEKHHQNYSGHPLPPPLPKSPSDSWLSRTLPSVATKRLSLRTYSHQNQFHKAPTSDDAKLDTIRRLHYPEGPLTTISET